MPDSSNASTHVWRERARYWQGVASQRRHDAAEAQATADQTILQLNQQIQQQQQNAHSDSATQLQQTILHLRQEIQRLEQRISSINSAQLADEQTVESNEGAQHENDVEESESGELDAEEPALGESGADDEGSDNGIEEPENGELDIEEPALEESGVDDEEVQAPEGFPVLTQVSFRISSIMVPISTILRAAINTILSDPQVLSGGGYVVGGLNGNLVPTLNVPPQLLTASQQQPVPPASQSHGTNAQNVQDEPRIPAEYLQRIRDVLDRAEIPFMGTNALQISAEALPATPPPSLHRGPHAYDTIKWSSKAMPTRDEDDLSCSICRMEYVVGETVCILPCAGRHHFHQECIKNWHKEASLDCAMCRAKFVWRLQEKLPASVEF
ncbi:uncharacterized protein HMPREF1541_09846 [Cyphellophora europaea CBS 101466]|uniref:RING-type domain-containing protein n=1 Tax=Cyphellophora europaea (strain CBS 101466) TaxID=1220924 RepID=W2S8E0_CYPE1|nr:uncharacterized protein HMPREF1541_09846 [Cyphellophora europaea CBS 101466]ETN44971.1 hypothetical protein HMPREF1541_09846 [Cyphellophora europaea CBS 101466]